MSLANELTISVDAANDGNPADFVFENRDKVGNRSVYLGPSYTPELREELAFYRTYPTKSGNFKGVLKSAVKYTADQEVPGVDSSTTLTVPAIVEVSFSIPVGADVAVLLRQMAIGILDADDIMDDVNVKQMI